MEENKRADIRFLDLWEVLKSCWIVVLVVAIIATAGLYLILHKTHQPKYTAQATIWSLRIPETLSSQDVAIGGALSNDFCILIMDDSVVEEVIERVGGMEATPQNIAAVKKMAKVENEPETRVLYLSITDQTPKRAAAIANAWCEVFCEKINANVGRDEIEWVQIFSEAKAPTQPSNQLALWMFLLIGVAIAILVYAVFLARFLLDDKLKTHKDIEDYLGLSVLGSIPDYSGEGAKRSAPPKV